MSGQRFELDVSDGENETLAKGDPRGNPAALFDFVSDIKERPTTIAKPPSLPKLKSMKTGFPEHKKRTKVSTFKQQRAAAQNGSSMDPKATSATQTSASSLTQENASFEENERRLIDAENQKRLDAMSEEDIEQERQELFAGLNPSLIERLLKRANIDEGRGDTGLYPPEEEFKVPVSETRTKETTESTAAAAKEEAPVRIPKPSGKRVIASKKVTFADDDDNDDDEPGEPINLQPASQTPAEPVLPPHPSVHFPSTPSHPELDPSDPNFLQSLHEKYFPELRADPSKLAWMAPIPTPYSPADLESPYSPAQRALPASALRFDFRGALLPPRISRAIPVSKGLHHHGEAPEAAGYTIPELARLARSTFPAQRCIAFQILGRVLYRLGRGVWRSEGEGKGKGGLSELEEGLWRCMEEGRVVQVLEGQSMVDGGHRGAKAYAVEALWLYRTGGGKAWKAA